LPVVEYSSPPPRNANASRALLFALLGFLPFLPGILAIRYGRRGLRDAEADPKIGGRSTARMATIIGIISVAVWTVLAILAVPATIQARRQALRVQCASQLRQLVLGAFMYSNANRGFFPPDLDTLTASAGMPPVLLTCPACAGDATKPVASTGAFGNYNYVYLGNGRRVSAIPSPMTVPLIYELPTNHDEPGINVAFADGHVEMLSGQAAQTFMIQVAAAAATQPITPPAAATPGAVPGDVEQ
jgi:prepilin-type processing-associated H-X9-DG protein